MIESKNRIKSLAAWMNIPCTPGGSLLKLSPRATDGAADRNPIKPFSIFQASPFFDTARKAARAFMLEPNQLVGVDAVVTPTEATFFDLTVMQTDNLKTNLPRRFLRENSDAKIPNTPPQPERTRTATRK